jgi:quercetin dioxygenase-like cupin family protein
MHTRINAMRKPGWSRRCTFAVAAAALALSTLTAPRPVMAQAAQAPDEETVAPVMQQAIPEASAKMILVATVTYAPGQASAPHKHPGSIFAYVVKGSVESQLEGTPARTYRTGEAWYEPPGAHHVVSRNASKTQPAQLLIFAVTSGHEPVKEPLER